MPSLSSVLLRIVSFATNHWPAFATLVNRFAIDSTVKACRPRPHPWSTVHPYVSWRSLSDKTFSARHLPAQPRAYKSGVEDVVKVFARQASEQAKSDKSTCLFPAFAQYLTDGFIRTRPQKARQSPEVRKQNTSNHEIDLCPLYGRTVLHTDALRLKSPDPKLFGRLKTQTLADGDYSPYLYDPIKQIIEEPFRGLDQPLGLDDDAPPEIWQHLFAVGGDRVNGAPQVAMMNTLFLREHNRLAGEIAASHRDWDDDRVFETARNVNIVQFIKIVVEEYINHISPTPIRFIADPTVAWNAAWNKPNWITTEFSLLYRWHSLIPDNIAWAGKTYPLEETIMNNTVFLKAGLLGSFKSLSAQPAAQLGAMNTASPLLRIEQLAIAQGRLCDLAPYTDYCEYMGLPRPETFEAISSRPEVVAVLKSLYDKPSDVEFYPGLFAEDPIPNSPLPTLLEKMVAVDAFSQALTNPLLSANVYKYKEKHFSEVGWSCIEATGSLRDILDRNVTDGVGNATITMTQPTWKQSW